MVSQTSDQRWRVVIELSGSATGHRALIGDNCAQLARASALIVALAANPEAALELPTEEPQAPAKSELPAARIAVPQGASVAQAQNPAGANRVGARDASPEQVPPPEENPPSAPNRPQQTPSFDLMTRAGYEWGSLPTSTGWLGLGFRTRPARWLSVGLGAHVTQGTSATFTNGVGASFRSFAAQGRLCGETRYRHLELGGCAGAQLSMIRAEGFVRIAELDANVYSSTATFTVYRFIPGPLLSFNPRIELHSQLLLEAGADLVVPVTKWQFVVEDLATLFRPNTVQYLLFLGLTYRPPRQ